MLLTFDNYAEIPEKLHLFYANAFDTLYSKHDATKSGYRRELRCPLSYDSFKKVFAYFCFSTYYQGKIELSCDDLFSILKKIGSTVTPFNPEDYAFDLTNSICVLYRDLSISLPFFEILSLLYIRKCCFNVFNCRQLALYVFRHELRQLIFGDAYWLIG